MPDLASPLLGQHSGDGPLSVPLSSAGSAQCGGASGLAAGECTRLPLSQLRKDAPCRRDYQRGSIPDLSSVDVREGALQEFDADTLALTSRASERSRTATLHKLMVFFWGGVR